MKPQPRWTDGGELSDDGLRDALQAARQGPSQAQLASLTEKLSQRVAARAAETKGTPVLSRWPRGRGLAVVVGLALLAALPLLLRKPAQVSSESPRTAQEKAPPTPRVPSAETTAPPASPPAAPDTPARATVAAEARDRSTPPRARRAPTAKPIQQKPAAGDEVTLLQAANRALLARPARALTLTSEHRAQFPHGIFEEERDAIAIEALLRLGRNAEARTLRDAFDQRFPGSTYRQRLDRLRSAVDREL